MKMFTDSAHTIAKNQNNFNVFRPKLLGLKDIENKILDDTPNFLFTKSISNPPSPTPTINTLKKSK